MTLLRSLVGKKQLEIVISPIVLLEYGYFQELHNKRHQFLRLLKTLRVGIEPIRKVDAIIAIKHSLIYKDDAKGPNHYFRDSLIASLSERLEVPVVTNNTNNFKGLPQKLKITTTQFVSEYKK